MKKKPVSRLSGKNPGNFYRSAPFWAWNEKLDPEELKRQVREMNEQGMGGFIIHSREGLETEYLSDEWMDCVAETLEEADRQEMEAWIYDEDKWPSGSAGGLVSTKGSGEFTARAVTAELLSRDEFESRDADPGRVLGIFILSLAPGDPGRLESFTPWNPGISSPSGDHVLICREEISGPSEWYNNLAPPDNLNPRSIQCFLDMTHEKYRERFSEHFGRTVRGFFTDEPNFCDFFSHFTPGRPWLPWSSVYGETFLEKRGYSPAEILPLLFFKGKGAEKARYDYWLTLTELFQSSYMKQIYQWCDRNGLELTGHVLYENDLGYSVRVSGAAMPHYRYMHAPGIDILGDCRQEYLTVKQCTSVANQFGRKTVFTETYGTTGWEFDFAGQKRIGDWQFVMGVNKRCQHLALYSLSGCRKRDYPPSFNYHNNWWPHDHILEDYFARLSSCVTRGDVERGILLIHPMGSYWMKSGSAMDEDLNNCQMNMGWMDRHILDLNREGDILNRLARDLLMSRFDFDFGDEMIMGEEGRITDGGVAIGLRTYHTVIVPRVETLMASTLSLLEEFAAAGGTLYWVEPFPVKIDAVDSPLPEILLNKALTVRDYGHLISELESRERKPLRICDNIGREQDGFLSMVRKDGSQWIYTIVNTEKTGRRDVLLHFAEKGELIGYDLLSGEKQNIPVCLADDRSAMTIQTTFGGEETKVFLVDGDILPERAQLSFPYRHPHYVTSLVQPFPSRTEYTLSRENTLTLDRCQFRTGENPWGEETLVWQGQKEIRRQLGMRPVYYNGAPQRYSWLNQPEAGPSLPLSQRFTFTVDTVPEGPVYAAVEKSSAFILKCNGRLCEKTDETFLDRAILKHLLHGLIPGENVIEIEMLYHEGIELEDIYLTGDFSVGTDRRMGRLPDTLRLGDWTGQGLFHYGGNVTYRFILPSLGSVPPGKKLLLHIGRFSGTLALVAVNGEHPVPLLQGDEDLDVTDCLRRDGENIIAIEIVGNLRNIMGPFHKGFTTCSRISWEDFRTETPLYTDEYRVHPFGLFDAPAIIEPAII